MTPQKEVILNMFSYLVVNHSERKELYNLALVIKNLRQNTDLLNAFFIDNEK